MPKSQAAPANVRISTSTPRPATSPYEGQRYYERKVETSSKSTGPCGWEVESGGSEWAKKQMDMEFLKLHSVEAILAITEDEVKAWKVDGSSHSDFEGYIRLKLQSNEKISFPMKFQRKTRLVVVKIPQNRSEPGKRSQLNVNLQTNESGYGNMYELTNGDIGGSEYRFQYIPVTAPKADKFAAIPATISISESTLPIELKAGQTFTVAGQTFTITAIRDFQKSDMTQNYGYGGQQKFFTTIVVKAQEALSASLYASLSFGEMRGYDPYTRVTIDDKGNLVREKVDPSKGWNGSPMNQPMLQTMGGNAATKEIYLVSNLNTKHLKNAVFTASATMQAKLENIPLEK